ncbi:GNAT family N-acetyltransferase [Petropleomorpha daqingensis]|uniref:RimJ/RimL family protein N-acetyltransferase n=1 Tax=Petropleomorpha daqingensis TaxID=2026353 RepID=A0A853CD86_9ACTN|nr:GNAT family N-acetyltransferase [Petropleomorpha daqingensis]NYJ05734.1 RimJ/RimL family protein N-acetyltransferase [Petropleomorpha daqingensis]
MPNEIATARLVLRRQRVDDAAAYREMWAERDPRVPPHRRIGADGRPTVEDIASQIDAETHSPNVGLLTITRSREGDVIGYCGLLFDGQSMPGEPELVYELLRRAHGSGFATEAAQAVVRWAADSGFERLWAGVRSWNLASRTVLHKLGFVETGRVVTDAEFGDSLITSKTLVTIGQ